MMPFGGYFDGYWRDTIRPALQSVGLTPFRADEVYGTGAIIEDIYTEMLQSDICLADVTNKNPNVSYELGMAHAANKPTIIITQNTSDVPFDYRHLRHIVYNPMESGWQHPFSATLKRTVLEVLNNPERNLALKTNAFSEQAKSAEAIRKHLLEIFLTQAQDVDRENRIYLGGENGCSIVTEWRGYAESRVHHICHNIVSDLPGKIELIEAYDVNEARELEFVVHEKSRTHLTYFVLFHNLKEPKQRFHI